VLAADGTQYHVVVSGVTACGSVTSTPATLHIYAPAITSQPVATSVFAGGSVTFTSSTSVSSPTYQWQYSSNGTSFSNVVDNTPTGVTYSNATTNTLTVNTATTAPANASIYYRLVVDPSGCSVASSNAQFTLNNYCFNTTSTTNTFISNFVTTGGLSTNISNNSGATISTNGYGDFSSQFVDQYPANTIAYTPTATGTNTSTKLGIWVDWNSDFDFDDAGENVVPAAAVAAGSFLVPSTASAGNYRMRVVINRSVTPTACQGATTNRTETEDYTVRVVAIPACAGTPIAGTSAISKSAICIGNSATVSVTGASANATGLSAQWYTSTNNVDFTPISGATSTSYVATPTAAGTYYYYYSITCANSSETAVSSTVSVVVSDPQLVSTTPSGRCGTGSVTLGATANAGYTINWYSALNGIIPVATGSSFVTPNISATTTYYAEATNISIAGGLGNTGAGPFDTTGATAERGIVFTATNSGTILSAQYYSPTLNVTNTATVRLVDDATGTQIGSSLSLPIVQGATAGFYTMNLNLDVTAGKTYRLLAGFSSSVNRIAAGVDYTSSAFNNLAPIGTITSGYDSGNSSSTYSYFHNIVVKTSGCASTRQAVVATVDPTPTATISYAGSPFCNNASVGSVTLTGTNAYTGGTFTSTSGLGLNGTTGAIDPTTSTPGTYTVTYTTNATTYCTPQTATATVVIYDSVLTSGFSYASASYCKIAVQLHQQLQVLQEYLLLHQLDCLLMRLQEQLILQLQRQVAIP